VAAIQFGDDQAAVTAEAVEVRTSPPGINPWYGQQLVGDLEGG
jgi:hypothetical protein